MVVARALAVRAQQAHAIGEVGVARDDGSAVAPAAEVLRRVEREAADVAERADALAAVEGAVRLRRVLDHAEARGAGDLEDRVQIDGRAHQVDRDHRARARADRGRDGLGRQQVRLGVDVDETRRRAGEADRLGRGDERVGRDDHLVAGADVEDPQREREGLGAGGDAHGVLGAAVGGELLLESRRAPRPC